MRKVGNVVSNKIYNSEGKKAPVPVDVDEVDSAMERFIRQKYMNNTATGGGQPQSPRSDEGIPPPLPPKNASSKFGLRSASSLFPLTSRSKKEKALPNPDLRRPSSHGSTNKPSQLFGASVNFDDDNETNVKLARLRDMGFADQQRNSIVLRGVNGNLERAIESLVRLGEGDGRAPAQLSAVRDPPLRASRSMTPLSTDGGAHGAGASLQARSNRDLPPTPSSTSTNPFDALNAAQPQTAQSTGSLQNTQGNQSWNPFDVSRKQSDPLGGAFQRLDINTSQQQPLFPNRTGGLTPQTQNLPPFPQHLMSTTPNSPLGFQHSMTYPQPQPQPQLQSQPTGYNPFFTNQATPTQQPSLTLNMPQAQAQSQPQRNFANNPFARSPTRVASPTSLGRIPEQSQSHFQAPSPMYSPVSNTNPFFASPAQTPTYGVPAGVPQQQNYFQPIRHDKASIMALYNTVKTPPQTQAQPVFSSPTQPLQTQTIPEFQTIQTIPEFQAIQSVQPLQPQGVQISPQPLRSMTEPVPQSGGNRNPFTNGSAVSSPTTDPFKTARQISRESVNLGMDLAWTNGRHSPDAFASLSARHG